MSAIYINILFGSQSHLLMPLQINQSMGGKSLFSDEYFKNTKIRKEGSICSVNLFLKNSMKLLPNKSLGLRHKLVVKNVNS